MKNLLLMLAMSVAIISCQPPAEAPAVAEVDDLALFKANKEIAQKYMDCYTGETNFELFSSMLHDSITHTSPMYGAGEVGKEQVLAQGKFYMTGFQNVTFEEAVWLPGVDNETLKSNGGVRVYGTWKGESIETGKSFALSAYHWMEIKDGQIFASGDFFDATGMMMAVASE